MQVDGEPCKVAPSIFTISLLNKATMLAHKKMGLQKAKLTVKNLEIMVNYTSMPHFQKYSSDRSVLFKSGETTDSHVTTIFSFVLCFTFLN